jgi:hypothetical protein
VTVLLLPAGPQPVALLPAPKVAGLLPAPRIAGLLPAPREAVQDVDALLGAVAAKLSAAMQPPPARPQPTRVFRQVGAQRVELRFVKWTEDYLVVVGLDGEENRYHRARVQADLRRRVLLIEGHRLPWATYAAAMEAGNGRPPGQRQIDADLEAMAEKARACKARVFFRPTHASPRRELVEVEWGEDALTYRHDSTSASIGSYRNTLSYERLARYLRRGMVKIEGMEHVPESARSRLTSSAPSINRLQIAT